MLNLFHLYRTKHIGYILNICYVTDNYHQQHVFSLPGSFKKRQKHINKPAVKLQYWYQIFENPLINNIKKSRIIM